MKRKDLKKEHYELIGKLSGLGMTQDNIAYCLNTPVRTFKSWLADTDNLDVKEAYDSGRAKVYSLVLNKLYDLIEQGDRASIFFFLKCQMGWKETQPFDSFNNPQVQIYLPKKDD